MFPPTLAGGAFVTLASHVTPLNCCAVRKVRELIFPSARAALGLPQCLSGALSWPCLLSTEAELLRVALKSVLWVWRERGGLLACCVNTANPEVAGWLKSAGREDMQEFSLGCSLSLGLIAACAEGRLAGCSWISAEVLSTSLLLLSFMQVSDNLGERLAGGNLVVEGWFFRAVLWISAQELSCLANNFFLCVLALRSGSALWETAALCSSSFYILDGFLVLLVWFLRQFSPKICLDCECMGSVSFLGQFQVKQQAVLHTQVRCSPCGANREGTNPAILPAGWKFGKGLGVYL